MASALGLIVTRMVYKLFRARERTVLRIGNVLYQGTNSITYRQCIIQLTYSLTSICNLLEGLIQKLSNYFMRIGIFSNDTINTTQHPWEADDQVMRLPREVRRLVRWEEVGEAEVEPSRAEEDQQKAEMYTVPYFPWLRDDTRNFLFFFSVRTTKRGGGLTHLATNKKTIFL